MPTFVKATKYEDAHYRRTSTEYRITFFNDEYVPGDDVDIDHYDKKAEAIALAKKHIAETGFQAVVEQLVWTEYAWELDGEWDDDGWGAKERKVFGEWPAKW